MILLCLYQDLSLIYYEIRIKMFSQSKKIVLAIGFSGNYIGFNYLKNLVK